MYARRTVLEENRYRSSSWCDSKEIEGNVTRGDTAFVIERPVLAMAMKADVEMVMVSNMQSFLIVFTLVGICYLIVWYGSLWYNSIPYRGYDTILLSFF